MTSCIYLDVWGTTGVSLNLGKKRPATSCYSSIEWPTDLCLTLKTILKPETQYLDKIKIFVMLRIISFSLLSKSKIQFVE